MRLLVFGNSGSGKSTLARRLADAHGLERLDLDAIVWEPGEIAMLRKVEDVHADVDAFRRTHRRWIMEGCYGALIESSQADCTEMLFLNPGEAACHANCRARPWEKEKYASKDEQDANLPMLISWVSEYYRRDDDMSYSGHRQIFARFGGAKRELTSPEEIAAYEPR